MTFLQSGLLATLAPLVLLPLVIHLLNRRTPVKIMFPDIERIRRSLAGRSNVAKWRHLLMMLLRTLAIALLLLAFLRPVLPRLGSEQSAASKGGGRKVLLIADRSLSMEHRAGTQVAASKRLLIEAGKILATLKPADKVNALTVSLQPEALLPEFTSSHDQVQIGLSALPPSQERADFAKALALAGTMLGEQARGAEVYILSDFQRSSWADVIFESMPEGVRIFFVDTSAGDRDRPNTAILRATTTASVVTAKDLVRLEITAANYSPTAVTLPLEAVVDGRLATPGEIKIAPWSIAHTSLELTAPMPGVHGVEVRSPDDALPADNHRWVKLEVREQEEILVLSDGDDVESGARFVLAALDPYDGKGGPFKVRSVKTGDVTPQQIGSVSRIVLTGVSRLSTETLQRLDSFVQNGGGLLWFLNGSSDGDHLERFNKLAGGSFVPFQLSGRLSTENFGGAPQKVARGNFTSRFLRLFRGGARQSLALLEFYALQRALPTGHGSVLLSFSDGMPALGSAEAGLGTALFCNFAPSELASNLARQRLFPAWMQDLVKALKPENIPDVSAETGGMVSAELWLNELEKSPIRAPDQSAVVVRTAVNGERVTANFSAPVAGLYTQGSPGALQWAGAVNVPEEEADLRGIDPAEVRRRSETGAGKSGEFIGGAQDYDELTTGRPVFHWFLLMAALLFTLEMLLFRPFLRAAGHPST